MVTIKNCLALKKSRQPLSQGNHTTIMLKGARDIKDISQYDTSGRNCKKTQSNIFET